jgi:alkanesulfonate monooxygenase SsuD/methylene tetrahydromethanopterin reductase-like flavin-dependent oxidoreductase (luciferase family)
MKFGLDFTPVCPWAMRYLASLAEECGFESLWTGEHVIVPFGGVPEADLLNFRPDSHFVEPCVALSHLAAATTTDWLVTRHRRAADAPPRSPRPGITTLDVLSNA